MKKPSDDKAGVSADFAFLGALGVEFGPYRWLFASG